MNWIVSFFVWLWSVISFFWPRRLVRLWPTRQPQRFRAIRVDEFPDALEASKIYLAGEGTHLWGAAMICPCGCGDKIELNLLRQVRPCWAAQEHTDGTISLAPSIWRQKGCRSHFFVRQGRIEWC